MSRRAVIADDEPNIVISLEFLLQQRGYETRAAANGEAALRAVEEFRPDLLILDVMMPMRSGFEVCESVRADPACRGTRIILLTAKGREQEVAKGMAAGADAYVTKPFATRELMETVERVMGGGAADRA